MKKNYKNEYKNLMNDCVCIIYEAQDFFELFDYPVPRPLPRTVSLDYILQLYVRLNVMFDRFFTFFQNNYEKMSYIDKLHYDINDAAIQSSMRCLETYLKREHNIDVKGECKL